MYEQKGAVTRAVCHGKLLLRGAAKTLYGTAVSALLALAWHGFRATAAEDGYAAVGDFVTAAVALGLGLGAMYAFGGRGKKQGRYVKG